MNADRERDEFWRIVEDLEASDPRLSRLPRGHRFWLAGRRRGVAARAALLVIGLAVMLVGVGEQSVAVGVIGFVLMLAGACMPDVLAGHRGPHRRWRRGQPDHRDVNRHVQ